MKDEEKIEVPHHIQVLAARNLVNQKRKQLDWFDYQIRGGRFEDKSKEDISDDRNSILDEIKELEDNLSELVGSN